MFDAFKQPSSQDADQVHMVPASQVMKWKEAETALIIDVREAEEFRAGHIPGAILMPLSTFDPSQLPDVGDKHLVLHCRSANRCGMATAKLLATGYAGRINRMESGIIGWAQAGGEIVEE